MAARHLIAVVMGQLPGLGFCADRCGDIEIALVEAVNNVVEHACRDIQGAEAWVSCWMKGETLIVKIGDTGRAMPADGPPSGSHRDLSGPVADLPEGGFGWFLIRQIATRVVYVRENGRNCLTLEFGPEKRAGCHETALFAPNCRPKQRS